MIKPSKQEEELEKKLVEMWAGKHGYRIAEDFTRTEYFCYKIKKNRR